MKLLRAGDLLGVAAASAHLRHHFQALATARIGVAPHVAVVRAALQQLAAGISARRHSLLPARDLVPLLPTRTTSVLLQRAIAAIARRVARAFANVHVARVPFVADFLARPRTLVAFAFLPTALAAAFQRYRFHARRTFARVTRATATVRAGLVSPVTYVSAAPIFRVTATRLCWDFSAVAFNRYRLSAWRAGAGMAQQYAFMATFGLEELAASLAARMWHDPWLKGRIDRLFAETSVRSWNLILPVLHSTFWTVKCIQSD